MPTSRLLLPTIATGVLMAAYLLLRPYGDVANSADPGAAAAFASGRWVAAHVCGALALAAFAGLALRLPGVVGGRLARVAAGTGFLAAVLVLPYYGAETFALHVLGRRAQAAAVLPAADRAGRVRPGLPRRRAGPRGGRRAAGAPGPAAAPGGRPDRLGRNMTWSF